VKHADLVAYVAAWLRSDRGFGSILTESSCFGTVEEPDIIAWKRGRSTLVECKRSRSDFLVDKRKPFRKTAGAGMGRTRFYASPPGIILPADIPDRWGLLEVTDGGRVQVIVEPKSFSEWNREGELLLLSAALERQQLPASLPPVQPKVGMRESRFGRRPIEAKTGGKATFDKAFPKVFQRPRA
jgi:hypothetical protein